jgi:glycosyltransferase involved in cell wall biosynthesis
LPRLSVLLPVRDAQDTLAQCLASLRSQTLADHEVVVVDDGSKDAGPATLEKWSQEDPRLRVLRTSRLGLVPALNLALAAARAPLVARMDADDLAHPERLEKQVRRLDDDARVDVLGCRVELVSEAGVPPAGGMRFYVDWSNRLLDHEAMERDRFVESPLVHPSVAMRRQALERLGGWRDFDGPEDYDLWLRGFEAGLRFEKLHQVLLRWRDRPGRLTRADPRYSPASFLATKVAALDRGPLASGRPVVVWGAGEIGKAWARALKQAGHHVKAFVEVHPGKIGERIQGAPVIGVSDAAALKGPLHLAAVGQRGARERIRAEAARLGLADGRDLLAVA